MDTCKISSSPAKSVACQAEAHASGEKGDGFRGGQFGDTRERGCPGSVCIQAVRLRSNLILTLLCAAPHREQADVRKDVALQVRHVDRVHVKAHAAGSGVVVAGVGQPKLCPHSWYKDECQCSLAQASAPQGKASTHQQFCVRQPCPQ
eukprot:scaffold20843_cov112-Isochrysis_galbana.AAC.2